MRDIVGTEVRVGDVVAYAWSRGLGAPGMNVGVVAKITPKGVSVKKKGGGTLSILHFPQRGLVLDKDSMSEAAIKAHEKIRTKCPFSVAWVGKCGKEVASGLYCEEHRKMKCKCGRQASRTCANTLGSFICGKEVCSACNCCGGKY